MKSAIIPRRNATAPPLHVTRQPPAAWTQWTADAWTFQISAWLRVQVHQAFPLGNATPGERFNRDLHLLLAPVRH